ncbi:MAG: hypothetical protein NWE88_04265 [Candidatus Bathyarchaeota archaeon]|jgi:hypothetical protein|nr:hypothetical protein [Candidatus Bathyarchaeota archaeon]
MSGRADYSRLSDEELVKETGKRLEEMLKLLVEIRDSLKAAGSID